MIITTWSEEFDGERIAMWIKTMERPDDGGPAVQLEKFSRQLDLPIGGLDTPGRLILMARELIAIAGLMEDAKTVRKYIRRNVAEVEAMLNGTPQARPKTRVKTQTATVPASEVVDPFAVDADG